jgi:hypothetical protein
MGDVFHGWRRKVGVVTLLVACVFADGWGRSLWYEDWLAVITSSQSEHYHQRCLFSLHGKISWVERQVFNALSPYSPSVAWGTNQQNGHLVAAPLFGIVSNWRWELGGFGYGDSPNSDGTAASSIIVIPYWSIVIPLILLSAWLLLKKPRSSTPMKTPEPIPEMAA